ncbi:hypothetical protein Tco_0646831 [Tanacetum coccineum]
MVHHQSYQAPPHQQPQASFPQLDFGLVVLSFLPTDDPIASLNKAWLSLALSGETKFEEIPTPVAFQTDDLDAFDSDYDEAPSLSAIFMAKLSSYDSDTLLEPHHVLSVTDIEEILELAEESRLKMHARQNDPIMQEKKVNIAPIDYVALNKLSEHFVKHFVPQKQLSTEQAFWLPIAKPVSKIPLVQPEPVLKEIPHELPKIKLIISQDLVHTAVNTLATLADYNKMEQSYVDEYNECLELKTGLSKKNDVVEKAVYNEEHADTLHEIIEHARDLRPLDSDLDSACKYATRVQELLVYVETHALVLSDKADSHKTKDFNNPLLPFTGVITSTSASGSNPQGNTKNNWISRPTSSNKKNKVEDHLRSVKPSLNKMNRVFEPICNANVVHSVLNVNSEHICATCNECMFDANYLNDVNVHAKPKCVKRNKKKIWKPTGKVYSNVGYSWKPTCMTFTIDGNTWTLTRITSTTVVPPKKPISTTVVKKTAPSSNTSGKLKDITNIGRSNCPLVPGLGNDDVVEIRGYGDYQIGNVMISRIYYMEGLGHNLFSVGQFCDSDLEAAFQKHTCYVCDLEGVDLLKGSKG